ncbi:hypothetical protein M409DRAFT_23953 [Zasmidium cellare ATCC 36951]|uniref:Uncharacterized protein n=1 Tax=Zasmidium cellare ATCC 36951 TaxID=1080233 RepID=A0A6A6CG94_ZASCE|nr:uncharacterized protein M409DRAFT_23953 [Zasmidium cellare ATCC 36951]KAF2165663.1 hypothetical protein M409DRAFT_23953 [Zasmidium cellare ATCC 36951]
MGAISWAVPVGVFAALAIVCFVFVWWWFPRAWNRGNKKDVEVLHEMSSEDREAQRRKNREIIERFTRARAIERGEIVVEETPEVEREREGGGKVGAGVREGEVLR